MRLASPIFVLLGFLITSTAAQCHLKPLTSEEKTRIVDVPARPARPRLSLQDALQIAEKFIASQKINITRHWLYRANFMVMGEPAKPQEPKIPGWHFWWLSDYGDTGNAIEIFVSMD